MATTLLPDRAGAAGSESPEAHARRRRRFVLERIEEAPRTVAELLALTGATETSIRTDLAHLEVRGKVRRVRDRLDERRFIYHPVQAARTAP